MGPNSHEGLTPLAVNKAMLKESQEVEVCENEGKHEHLRDLYYRKYRRFTLLTDADIDHVIVTYYNDTWDQLLARMEWYYERKHDDAVMPLEMKLEDNVAA